MIFPALNDACLIYIKPDRGISNYHAPGLQERCPDNLYCQVTCFWVRIYLFPSDDFSRTSGLSNGACLSGG
jgi:hypothetical protein